MLLSNCVAYGKKKPTSIKNKEFSHISNDWVKMNKIINTFLLTGDKFILEFNLKRPGFIYSACGPFTKHHERI